MMLLCDHCVLAAAPVFFCAVFFLMLLLMGCADLLCGDWDCDW